MLPPHDDDPATISNASGDEGPATPSPKRAGKGTNRSGVKRQKGAGGKLLTRSKEKGKEKAVDTTDEDKLMMVDDE